MCLVLAEFSILVSQLCCETSRDLMAGLTNVTDDSLPQKQEILQPEFVYCKYMCFSDVRQVAIL